MDGPPGHAAARDEDGTRSHTLNVRMNRIRAVLLDMGGVLIPVRGYRRAVDDPDLIRALERLGLDDPAALVLECAGRVAKAYDGLAEECSQPDLDRALRDVPPPARLVLLDAFRRQASPRPFDFARSVVA